MRQYIALTSINFMSQLKM